MMRIEDVPISHRQQQVYTIVRDQFGGDMAAEPQNYRKIADVIGWKGYHAVRDCLYVLRAKGAVRSVGRSLYYPERWVVIKTQ